MSVYNLSQYLLLSLFYSFFLFDVCFYFCERVRLTYVLNSDLTWICDMFSFSVLTSSSLLMAVENWCSSIRRHRWAYSVCFCQSVWCIGDVLGNGQKNINDSFICLFYWNASMKLGFKAQMRLTKNCSVLRISSWPKGGVTTADEGMQSSRKVYLMLSITL